MRGILICLSVVFCKDFWLFRYPCDRFCAFYCGPFLPVRSEKEGLTTDDVGIACRDLDLLIEKRFKFLYSLVKS